MTFVENLEPVIDGGVVDGVAVWDPEEGILTSAKCCEPRPPAYELVDVDGVLTPFPLGQREDYDWGDDPYVVFDSGRRWGRGADIHDLFRRYYGL